MQWRTEEGVRGLEPLPLAYDLRNKRARMHQNMVFSTKIRKIFCGEAQPPPQTLPVVGRGTPPPHVHRLRRLRHLDPPILKSWIRHWWHVQM